MERLRPTARTEESAEDAGAPGAGESAESEERMLIGEEGKDFWIEKELSFDEMKGLKFDEYDMVRLARKRWNERQRHERAMREAEEERRRRMEGAPAEGDASDSDGGTPAAAPDGSAEATPPEPPATSDEGTPGEGAHAPTIEDSARPGEARNLRLGDTEISATDIKTVPFFDDLKLGETPEEFEERKKHRDQNVLMAGLLFTEAGDENGMKKAIEGGNYRLPRRQLREFYTAVANLPEDAYADKVVALLPAFSTEEERQRAMAAAIRIHDHALVLRHKELADELESEIRRDFLGDDDRAPRIEVPEPGDGAPEEPAEGGSPEAEGESASDGGAPESVHEPGGESDGGEYVLGRRHESDGREGPYGTYRVYRPEASTPQAERVFDNPSVFYRRRKQERRAKGFFATMREAFRGESSEERRRSPSGSRAPERGSTRVRPEGSRSAGARVRPGSRPEGGYFGGHPVETGGARRPEGGYFGRAESETPRSGDAEPRAKGRRRWDFSTYNDIDGADYAL